MSALLSQFTGFIDSVLGIEAAAVRRMSDANREVPCNVLGLHDLRLPAAGPLGRRP